MRLDTPDGWRKYLRPQISQARQVITERIALAAAGVRQRGLASVGQHRVIREAIRDFAHPLVQSATERLNRAAQSNYAGLDAIETALLAAIHSEIDLLPNWIASMPDSRTVWAARQSRDTNDLCNFAKNRAADWIASAMQDVRDRMEPSDGDPGSRKSRRRTPGRPGAKPKVQEKEAKLVNEWQGECNRGTYKADFARQHGLVLKDFERLLRRVSARKRRKSVRNK